MTGKQAIGATNEFNVGYKTSKKRCRITKMWWNIGTGDQKDRNWDLKKMTKAKKGFSNVKHSLLYHKINRTIIQLNMWDFGNKHGDSIRP